ncbi:hypothetical protein O181_008295 [Austropuccinia psidii MF-1]|uniref:Uncharacterized protein n=1 Tax=Austropuccinia psidii MF-1 TaxID=1389203 RepID=A0A9Q3GIR6_9BASI|nr:hypothetical protein [Austropuccinia psidii MF-1]
MSLIGHAPPLVSCHSASFSGNTSQTGATQLSSLRTTSSPSSLLSISPAQNSSATALTLVNSANLVPSESILPSCLHSNNSKNPLSTSLLPNVPSKRRKLRRTRAAESSSSSQSSSSSSPPAQLSLRSHVKKQCFSDIQPHLADDRLDSEAEDDNQSHPVPLQRTMLKGNAPPLPPKIPLDQLIEPCLWSESLLPSIRRSSATPRGSALDSYTCIRTKVNPFSVPVCSKPALHFSKTLQKLVRSQGLPNATTMNPDLTMELKRSEEQNKWWHWSTNCPDTGDGNKSSHKAPLQCQNLVPKAEESFYTSEIVTRKLSVNALEEQNFYCLENSALVRPKSRIST